MATIIPPPTRRVFCNRTLNLRGIRAIGFDMDYTLIQYRSEQWEERAYNDVKRRLLARGWPIETHHYDPKFAMLGLIVDIEAGNLVKANRFGYIKRACHGTAMLDFDSQRRVYSRVQADPKEPRWVPINTLFGMSKACLYAQLVDDLEAGKLPGVHGYTELYRIISAALDQTHTEGELKAEITRAPERFVEVDPELPQTLLDLKQAGKRLLLITNSDWPYTRAMMSFAFDRFLPAPGWRGLFDLVLVSARKPLFFSQENPAFEVVDESGLLRPVNAKLETGRVYLGGSATLIEAELGLTGDDILYVGDHIRADVYASKTALLWRTALVVPELAQELEALAGFAAQQVELNRLMNEKEALEYTHARLRLAIQRSRAAGDASPGEHGQEAQARRELDEVKNQMTALDERISPLAAAAGALFNERWGLLMRTGNDKSFLARQLENSADIYLARVSHLQVYTPYAFFRSPAGHLPHDFE